MLSCVLQAIWPRHTQSLSEPPFPHVAERLSLKAVRAASLHHLDKSVLLFCSVSSPKFVVQHVVQGSLEQTAQVVWLTLLANICSSFCSLCKPNTSVCFPTFSAMHCNLVKMLNEQILQELSANKKKGV